MDEPIAGAQLTLIGLGLDPDLENPEFYLLMFSDESGHDVPLTQEQRILIFRHPREVEQCIAIAGPPYASMPPPNTDRTLILDINHFLYLVLENERGEDVNCVILNVLNTLFDVVDATEHRIAGETKHLLHDAADYFTFHTNIAGFFADGTKTPLQLVNGVLWMVGVVFASSRLLEAMDETPIVPTGSE